MADRFVLLRGIPVGSAFLARPDHYGDADTWTEELDEARGFTTRAEADAVRDEIVARDGFAVAVVPDRVGPGPERPAIHNREIA